MEQAINAYQTISVSPEFREAARLRELARHNEATALRHAEEKGMEKGREEIARNMLRSGFSVDQIASLSGLDVIKIKTLAEA